MSDEYNGWTNRETWAVALHIDNDEGLHDHRNSLCQTASVYGDPDNEHGRVVPIEKARVHLLARELQDWIESLFESLYFPGGGHGVGLLPMFHDIGSLWRVNWDEIASNWLSDFEPE